MDKVIRYLKHISMLWCECLWCVDISALGKLRCGKGLLLQAASIVLTFELDIFPVALKKLVG